MRARCVPTMNRDKCRCWWPRGVKPMFLRNALVYKTSTMGTGNETGGEAFGTFEARTEREANISAARGVAVCKPGPPGQIRQLLQRILDNQEGCRQRGRNGPSLGWCGAVMSTRAAGEE